jgi:hypothetical protein
MGQIRSAPQGGDKKERKDCAFISGTAGSGRAVLSNPFLIPRLSRFTLSAYTVYYKKLWLVTYACHAAGIGQSWERYLQCCRTESQSA